MTSFEERFDEKFGTIYHREDGFGIQINDQVKYFIKSELDNQRVTNDEKWVERIKAHMFMYEHQRIGKGKKALCETCREVVTDGTPCKDSPYYKVWLDLSDLLRSKTE
jgi:hypothetical protein